jgi:hypothetical protein
VVYFVLFILTLVNVNHVDNQVKDSISAIVVNGLIFLVIFILAFILTVSILLDLSLLIVYFFYLIVICC